MEYIGIACNIINIIWLFVLLRILDKQKKEIFRLKVENEELAGTLQHVCRLLIEHDVKIKGLTIIEKKDNVVPFNRET